MASDSVPAPTITAVDGGLSALGPQLAERAQRRRNQAISRRVTVVTLRIALLCAIVGIWAYYSSRGPSARSVVATPREVGSDLWHWLSDSSWWSDVGVTLKETVIGYAIGALIALLLIGVVVPVAAVDRFVSPFIAALNALPKLLLYPLFVIWFGLGSGGKQLFVASVIFPILFYSAHAGISSIEPHLIQNARVLGASTFQLVRTVYVPAITSWLLVSMRVAISVSLLSAVIAEYMGSFSGMGYVIANASSLAQTDIVLAAVIFVGVLAAVIDRVLALIQRHFTSWSIF